MTTPPTRRSDDRMTVPFFLAGVLFMGAAVALKLLQPATKDWLVIALAVLGAALLPTDRVLRLVRIWRRNGNGDSTPPAGPTS